MSSSVATAAHVGVALPPTKIFHTIPVAFSEGTIAGSQFGSVVGSVALPTVIPSVMVLGV